MSIKLKEALEKAADEYTSWIVKENLESMEDGLEEIPKDQWRWAINTKNFRCPKCGSWIPAFSTPPHIHKRKPIDQEVKEKRKHEHWKSWRCTPPGKTGIYFGTTRW